MSILCILLPATPARERPFSARPSLCNKKTAPCNAAQRNLLAISGSRMQFCRPKYVGRRRSRRRSKNGRFCVPFGGGGWVQRCIVPYSLWPNGREYVWSSGAGVRPPAQTGEHKVLSTRRVRASLSSCRPQSCPDRTTSSWPTTSSSWPSAASGRVVSRLCSYRYE